MDIPSPSSGVVQSIQLKVGDKVSEGDVILILSSSSSNQEKDKPSEKDKTETNKKTDDIQKKQQINIDAPVSSSAQSNIEICIPDIGGSTDVDVIEVLVQKGDKVKKEQSLITLEGDKATMDVPSPYTGQVETVLIKVGIK